MVQSTSGVGYSGYQVYKFKDDEFVLVLENGGISLGGGWKLPDFIINKDK